MPIFLVDSNFLREPALAAYFKVNRSNQVAITHHILVEAHKEKPRETIIESFKICREFHDRILLLNDVTDSYAHRLDTGKKIKSRLIDRSQSGSFAIWYDDIVSGAKDSLILKHLALRQEQSRQIIENFSAQAHDFEKAFREMRKVFTANELKEIRARIISSKSTQDKLINWIYEHSKNHFKIMKNHLSINTPYYRDAPHYFLFRYAMCVVMFFIRWVKNGNLSTDTNKLVNHIIDLHIAAQATYFHGVLTNDHVVSDVHRQSRLLLNMMGAHRFTMRKGTFVNG